MSDSIKEKEKKKEKAAVKREIKRLNEIYAEIDEKKKKSSEGLIENAAYTRIKLQSLKAFIDENGFTEMFSQSENQTPYARTRPEAEMFNKLLGHYLKYIKELNDLLPKPVKTDTVMPDGFDMFVESRDKA
ncbi:MAG: hypothetical protein UIH27_11010 [Ruminococcus sp.]|nr:hypothetical protein [Ruminococcus sp.]